MTSIRLQGLMKSTLALHRISFHQLPMAIASSPTLYNKPIYLAYLGCLSARTVIAQPIMPVGKASYSPNNNNVANTEIAF